MSFKFIKHKLNISREDRIQFWSIFTTGIVGLFSLWLGITIQDDINTKNAQETQKLARYQMAEAIYPKFVQYIDTCGYVFYDLLELQNIKLTSDEEFANAVGSYYKKEQMSFIETINNSVNFLSDNQYYLGAIFGKNIQKRICQNNTSILFGLHLLEQNYNVLFSTITNWQNNRSIQDYVAAELSNPYYVKNVISFREEINKSLSDNFNDYRKRISEQKADSIQIINNAIFQFIYLPFIDNFNIYSQELVPSDDVTSHIVKHFILFVGCILLGLLLFLFLMQHVFGISLLFQRKRGCKFNLESYKGMDK